MNDRIKRLLQYVQQHASGNVAALLERHIVAQEAEIQALKIRIADIVTTAMETGHADYRCD